MAASSLLDSQLARYLCAFFVSYLIFDLALGSVFYPKHVHPLSGYFHHTLYIYMVIALLHYKVPGGFATCGILELPTSIMAVGCFNKKWRNDLLFGTTFFATRIALHAYFIADLYAAFPGRYLWVFLAGVFPLHVMWFRGWITQQTRLRKQRLAAVVEKERMEAVTEKNSTRAKVVVGPTDGEIQGWEMVRGPVAASRAISRPKRRRSQPSILLRTGAPVPEILKTERYTPICVPVA
ncbi:hypothetical protein HK104_010789 [Borealophlyctis nickersoniae]|nr:hypothetical protein HK104_010789 [Borealophlyctis nickersoniae]